MLPLWVPATAEKFAGLFQVDGRKAWNAGLDTRALTETMRDCANYESALAEPKLVGLSREEELALLASFKAASN